jgi:hypothetical protein
MYYKTFTSINPNQGVPMLKINGPYVRETISRDPSSGKSIIIRIDPPGHVIGFRVKHSKQTYTLPIVDAFNAARGGGSETMIRAVTPREIREPDIPHEIYNVLVAHPRLHFAQLREQLRSKRIELDKKAMGAILKLLKEAGTVKQDGFEYSIVPSAKVG